MISYNILGLPGSCASKKSTSNAGDPSSIPGSGRSPGERIGYPLQYSWASPVAQTLKNPPAMQGTWIQSLGWEEIPWRKKPLEKGTAIHSSILAWRIPWTEEPGRLQSMGLQRVGGDWATFTLYTAFFFFSVRLTSFNIISSKSIHVATNGKTSFFSYGWVVFH